jgi:hypothetical protein
MYMLCICISASVHKVGTALVATHACSKPEQLAPQLAAKAMAKQTVK